MIRQLVLVAVVVCIPASSLVAQEAGTASGKGVIEREGAAGSESVGFQPHFSLAYAEAKGATRATWIVLTEKEPPIKAWAAAKDRDEARRLWCEKERTPFVALKLDKDWKVDLYFLCPANGGVNTEMLSTWNGLDSVVVTFEVRTEKRLKGTLRTGQGSCPDDKGGQVYCTPTGDYAFDTPLSK
jgi:hypothetical protein